MIFSSEISRQRATAMEGVFGDHKNHYELNQSNAAECDSAYGRLIK